MTTKAPGHEWGRQMSWGGGEATGGGGGGEQHGEVPAMGVEHGVGGEGRAREQGAGGEARGEVATWEGRGQHVGSGQRCSVGRVWSGPHAHNGNRPGGSWQMTPGCILHFYCMCNLLVS